MLLFNKAQAQTPWLDSLYVRVADADVDRTSGSDAIVVFDIEVYRPVREWNKNDTTLGASDFVFGKAGKDLNDVFKNVNVVPLHEEIGGGKALSLMGRIVLGKLQVSLTPQSASRELKLPYREWVKLCRVSLTLKDPSTVELGVVWDATSTGFITAKNVPILESLQDDLDKIPDKVLTFEEYASSQSVCSGEEFFLFAHAVSSGTGLNCAWHYSVDNGTTFTPLTNVQDWGDATGGSAFRYKVQGEYADTLWLQGITANLSGIIFKCVAEDATVTAEKRETPDMVLKVLPEVQVALEGYASLADFQSNLGISGDTARRCPGEKASVRVAFYGIENTSQLNNLKGMGGYVHIAYRWIDKLGGDGRDTLSVRMSDIAAQSINWHSGFVVTSDKLQLNLEEDGKYYIHKVWTDSCTQGTVLTAYDTVVVKENGNVNYEFDPIEYVAGSGDINVAADLNITFTAVELKPQNPTIGSVLGWNYSAPAGMVGVDTVVYYYRSGNCTVTATRRVNVISGKHIAIKVLLEGPYIAKADTMRCIYEPYFTAILDNYVSPYADRKKCTKPFPKFDRSVVDWIYVEVWDYPPNGKTLSDTKRGVLVDSTSALLLSDGTVVGVDGNRYVSFDHLKDNSYYIKIRHRNHLSIMSANPVTFTAGAVTAANTIDFNKLENILDQDPNMLYPAVKNVNGRYAMYGGDINGDGLIATADRLLIIKNLNSVGYEVTDIDFDGMVLAADRNFTQKNANMYIKY